MQYIVLFIPFRYSLKIGRKCFGGGFISIISMSGGASQQIGAALSLRSAKLSALPACLLGKGKQ